MNRTTLAFLSGAALLIAHLTAAPVSAHEAGAPRASSERIIYLNQGWSQEDRDWYYHFSQGSAFLSYDIYLNLELAGSQELLRSGANYGLLPEPANSSNPDGLPIGISKTTVATPIKGWPAGDYAGVTCAACHEGELTYKGKRIRIQGGNSRTIDLQGLARGLDDALQASLSDAAKFNRLAARLGASSTDAKDKLRKRVESEVVRVHQYATRTVVSPHPWGPGRMDAVSLIMARTTSELTGIPENWSPGIAPAKPPFLWNTPQGLWAQWGGYAYDPLSRNLGETMGVYLPIDLSSKTPVEGLFQSNAAILELARAENQLARLAPPSWPEDVFGRIDREKAKTGKALFMVYCASCHNAWPYRWTEPNKYGKRFITVGLIPQTYVGTDRAQFDILNTLAITGGLSDFLPGDFRGKTMLNKFLLNLLIGDAVQERALHKLNLTEAQSADVHGYRELPAPPSPAGVYKAAPRDGVWATAPFMHNGSVPNLYEMLIPAAERTKKFYLGGDFDPIKVGLDTTATSGSFLMDTTLSGNSNAGHSFQNGPRGDGIVGPLLTDDQRWALVEYLKSIPEQPGRITPFGGFNEDRIPQP
jgi:hypothetical protein